jgi:CubicO group peptidase (beta-lactamase class C family)
MKKLLFLLAIPVAVFSQHKAPQLMDDYMNAEFNVKEFNGSVLVVQKGKTVFQKSYGMADREWSIPNTNQTKYRIGSVTKQFAAATILRLNEEGKLQLDDKLSKYFPDYPKGDSVTIHMLLNHTSGIKNYTDLPEFWPKAILPLSHDSMIALFKNKPYDFSPGTNWNYSNSGYYLLGVIVEKVSGKKFTDYLQQEVINKAGLQNTSMDRLDSVLAYRSKGYAKNRTGGYNQAMFISMEGPYSAGAMFSTLEDLVAWTKALHENKILSAAFTQKMMTPYLGNYGYGLLIDSLKTHKRVWHNGGIPGFSAHLAYYPADDLYVAAISNNEMNADRVGSAMASISFGLPVSKPYIPKEVKIDPAILDRYTGNYMATNPIEILKKNNRLYRRVKTGPEIELKPESGTRFFYADGSDRFIEFDTDKSGQPVKAWFLSGGDKIEMKKMDK